MNPGLLSSDALFTLSVVVSIGQPVAEAVGARSNETAFLKCFISVRCSFGPCLHICPLADFHVCAITHCHALRHSRSKATTKETISKGLNVISNEQETGYRSIPKLIFALCVYFTFAPSLRLAVSNRWPVAPLSRRSREETLAFYGKY